MFIGISIGIYVALASIIAFILYKKNNGAPEYTMRVLKRFPILPFIAAEMIIYDATHQSNGELTNGAQVLIKAYMITIIAAVAGVILYGVIQTILMR